MLIALLVAPTPAYANDPDLPSSGVAPVTEALAGLAGDGFRPEGTHDGSNISEVWVRNVQDRDCPGQPTTVVAYTLSSADVGASFVRLGSFTADGAGFGRFSHGQAAGKPIFLFAAGKNNACQLTARAKLLAGSPITVGGCWKDGCFRKPASENFCMSGARAVASDQILGGRWQADLMYSPSCSANFSRFTLLKEPKNTLTVAILEKNGDGKSGALVPAGAVSVQTPMLHGGPGTKYRACMFETDKHACGAPWHTP